MLIQHINLRFCNVHTKNLKGTPSGGSAGCREEKMKCVAHCPLPILDTNIYNMRYHRGPLIHCRVCGTRQRATEIMVCDTCNARYHLYRLDIPLMRKLDEPWQCRTHKIRTHYDIVMNRLLSVSIFSIMSLTTRISLERTLCAPSLCDEALKFLARIGRNIMMLILESTNASNSMEGSCVGEGPKNYDSDNHKVNSL